MIKIAYLHRLTFEETEGRFVQEAEKLDIELVPIKYRQLKLIEDKIFYKNRDLTDFDIWYFRAIGSELEWAKLLEIYAKKNNIPVVDEYLINHGPLRRFKSVMGVQLFQAGVNYPKTTMVESMSDLKEEIEKWTLPVIVKLSSGGRHGMGTFWMRKKEDLNELEEKLEERKRIAREEKKQIPIFRNFLIQEYIANDGDYRVMTVGYKCIGGFKRQPKKEKLVMNKSLGKSVGLTSVPKEVIEEAEKAASALKVEIAGIDLVKDELGKVYIVEVNEAPQFKIFEKRTKVNVAKTILEYIANKTK